LEQSQINIESNCGIAPEGISYFDPGNDPNFIFRNDPNFIKVTLYDPEGNIAIMNSWLECAHYINGGWSNAQILNYQGDRIMFLIASLFAVISSVYYFSNIREKYVKK